LLRRLLTDNALLAVQYAASALVPLLLVPHIVRSIGAAAYGRIAIAVAALSYASVIVQYAFQVTGPAEFAAAASARERQQIFVDAAVARLLLLGALAGLLVIVVPLGMVVGGADPFAMSYAHWWVLVALPAGAALHSGWYLQSTGRLVALAAIAVAAAAVALGVGLVHVDSAQPDAALWAAIALALGPLLAGAGTFAWSMRPSLVAQARPDLHRSLAALRRGREIFASQFVAALYSLGGPIVVGVVAGERAAGLYSAVERVSNALHTALTLSHTAAFPRLAALYAAARPAYLRLVRLVVLLYAVGVLFIGVLLAMQFETVSRFVLDESSAETAALLGLAWLWLALGIFGPLITGYWTVSGRRGAVLLLTLRVLLVSSIAGCAGAVVYGGSGWLAGLVLGQLVVLFHAAVAYRSESAREQQG